MKLEWKTCLKIGVTAFVLFLCIHYWDAFMKLLGLGIRAAFPLIIGVVIAYVVNILMVCYERGYVRVFQKERMQKPKRAVCMVLAYLTIFLIIALVIIMIVPELIACITMIVEKLPDALSRGYEWLDSQFEVSKYLDDGAQMLKDGTIDWQSGVKNVLGAVLNGVGGAMGSIVSFIYSLFSSVVNILLALIFSIYILASKEKLLSNFKRVMEAYCKTKTENRIIYIVKTLNESFHNFIVGQCLEAVIIGVLCMLGMFILRIPYASMIGCLIGFTALIPVAGAYIGAVVGAFMIFTVSPIKALIFLIFLVILQQLEGNLIYPKVVGTSLSLPGIWVLAAVIIGGGLLGVGGMLLGVPIAAACYKILRKDVLKREKQE